jgi:uncharacterized protein
VSDLYNVAGMFILAAIGLIILNTVWLALLLVGLPGSWLMVVSAGLATWWTWHDPTPMFSLMTLGTITALAALGEVIEFSAGLMGARQAGASRRGGVGALLGGIVGAIAGTIFIPIPVLGSIIGACAGAFAGAMMMEVSGGRDLHASFRSGIGAGKGRFWGTVGKLIVGVTIWLVVAMAAFV